MTKTTELLGKEREKVVFLYKNNKEHKIDNNIKEIRELPSMICDDLDISNPFDYIYKGYAITESLYPNKEYEIAIRTDTKVLFFKVPWSDVSVSNIKDFSFTTSYHLLEDETKEIKEDDELKRLLGIVKRHYLILIKNIQDYKEI